MPVSRDFDYGRFTPLDNTLSDRNIFKSAYKNIRFGVTTTQQITLKAVDAANLPGLAFTYYGDASLWRALLAFNGLQDALCDVVVGMTLKIPTKSDINAFLSKQQANSNPTLVI